MTPVSATPGWTVLLPLKGGAGAKSRLGGPAGLAQAMAQDAADAVRACPAVARVLVVTADAATAAWATDLGMVAVPESAPGRGLVPALADGLAHCQDRTAILLPDLPALNPATLTLALDQCASVLTGAAHPVSVFVPDAQGEGTVLLAGLDPAALRPQFGPRSAQAHQADGSLRLELDLPRLRTDVDSPGDLAEALKLGVGPRTASVVLVQATVHRFDEFTGQGAVITDSGQVIGLPATAWQATGLRKLRIGQRLFVTMDAQGNAIGKASIDLAGLTAD